VYRQDALATSTLTVEQCLFSCKAGGYPLAGVEYGVRELDTLDDSAALCFLKTNFSRANVIVVLCLEMVLRRSPAANVACHAMATLLRLAEDLRSSIFTLPRISNQASRAKV